MGPGVVLFRTLQHRIPHGKPPKTSWSRAPLASKSGSQPLHATPSAVWRRCWFLFVLKKEILVGKFASFRRSVPVSFHIFIRPRVRSRFVISLRRVHTLSTFAREICVSLLYFIRMFGPRRVQQCLVSFLPSFSMRDGFSLVCFCGGPGGFFRRDRVWVRFA